ESQNFKGVLSEVATRVNEGASLADAMSRYPKVFPDLYINMIRAGEASGALETVLFRLAEFMEKQLEIRSKVTSAMFYPILLAFLGVGIITVLMVSIVPKIATMFTDMNAELPWNTKLLMFLSDSIIDFWYLIVLFIGGAVWAIRR